MEMEGIQRGNKGSGRGYRRGNEQELGESY